MKLNKLTIVMSLILPLTLTACGSGGSNDTQNGHVTKPDTKPGGGDNPPKPPALEYDAYVSKSNYHKSNEEIRSGLVGEVLFEFRSKVTEEQKSLTIGTRQNKSSDNIFERACQDLANTLTKKSRESFESQTIKLDRGEDYSDDIPIIEDSLPVTNKGVHGCIIKLYGGAILNIKNSDLSIKGVRIEPLFKFKLSPDHTNIKYTSNPRSLNFNNYNVKLNNASVIQKLVSKKHEFKEFVADQLQLTLYIDDQKFSSNNKFTLTKSNLKGFIDKDGTRAPIVDKDIHLSAEPRPDVSAVDIFEDAMKESKYEDFSFNVEQISDDKNNTFTNFNKVHVTYVTPMIKKDGTTSKYDLRTTIDKIKDK